MKCLCIVCQIYIWVIKKLKNKTVKNSLLYLLIIVKVVRNSMVNVTPKTVGYIKGENSLMCFTIVQLNM
jgi:hypothetical protein